MMMMMTMTRRCQRSSAEQSGRLGACRTKLPHNLQTIIIIIIIIIISFISIIVIVIIIIVIIVIIIIVINTS